MGGFPIFHSFYFIICFHYLFHLMEVFSHVLILTSWFYSLLKILWCQFVMLILCPSSFCDYFRISIFWFSAFGIFSISEFDFAEWVEWVVWNGEFLPNSNFEISRWFSWTFCIRKFEMWFWENGNYFLMDLPDEGGKFWTISKYYFVFFSENFTTCLHQTKSTKLHHYTTVARLPNPCIWQILVRQ